MINSETIEKAKEISKKFNVSELFLFGSCLENISTANDLDLACKGISDKDFLKLAINLENELDVSVDLVNLHYNSSFNDYILKNALRII